MESLVIFSKLEPHFEIIFEGPYRMKSFSEKYTYFLLTFPIETIFLVEKEKVIINNYIFRNWAFGPFLCTATNFMSYYTVTVSVYFLLALTVER